MHYLLTTLILLLFHINSSYSKTNNAMDFAGKSEMNGFRLNDFKGFEKNWHFVTVRFRKDTGEMRFTYANDKAWEVMSQNQINYPEGAAFAKIAVATQDDSSFPSSAVPSGARRIQFMVKDNKKYADTDGWGYALFNSEGKTFPEDPKLTVRACAACHKIVPERGFVFSQNMNSSNLGVSPLDVHFSAQTKLTFDTISTQQLSTEVQALLPQKTKKVRSLQGTIKQSLFQGTLDEIRPLLASESFRSKMPTLLISEDGTRYSIVFIDEKIKCEKNQTGFHSISNIYFDATKKKYEIDFCK